MSDITTCCIFITPSRWLANWQRTKFLCRDKTTYSGGTLNPLVPIVIVRNAPTGIIVRLFLADWIGLGLWWTCRLQEEIRKAEMAPGQESWAAHAWSKLVLIFVWRMLCKYTPWSIRDDKLEGTKSKTEYCGVQHVFSEPLLWQLWYLRFECSGKSSSVQPGCVGWCKPPGGHKYRRARCFSIIRQLSELSGISVKLEAALLPRDRHLEPQYLS